MITTTRNEAIIYDYLTSVLHLSPAGAAALLGNFEVESGFRPRAWNPNEQARGLAQWEGGRRAALQRYAAAHGGRETDLRIQLGFLRQELLGPYRFVYDRLRRTRNASTAAAFVDANYEVSSGDARAQRVGDAQTIYQQIRTSQLTATSSPTGGLHSQTSGGAAGFASSSFPIPGSSLLSHLNPSELLPWNWGKDISGAVGGVVQTVIAFLTKMLFVGLGLALVLLGIYTAARPSTEGSG